MKGYKDFAAAQHLVGSAPKNEDFNPYDYIDQSHYRNTARGRMAYQEDLAKLLYMAQINQEERMNEYNSEQAQVERQKLAGLNPDLNGVQSNPAANVAGYSGNPMDGTQSTLQNVGDVFGIVSSVVSMTSAVINGGMSLFGAENAVSLADSAVSLFNSAPSSLDIKNFIQNSPLSARAKKRLKGFYDSYFMSNVAQSKNYDEWNDLIASKKDNWLSKISPLTASLFDGDPAKGLQEFSDAWKPLIEAQESLLLEDSKGKKAIARYNQGRYDYDLGKSERDALKTQKDLYDSLRKPISDVLDNLKQYDQPWAIWMRGLLSAFFLQKFGDFE